MKILTKYHLSLVVGKTAPGDFDIVVTPSATGASGWQKLDGVTFLSTEVLDLAGMSMEEKTIMFDGITVQHGGYNTRIVQGSAGDSMNVLDIVSTIPLAINTAIAANNVLIYGAGFPQTDGDFQSIPYQRLDRYTVDLDTQSAFAYRATSESASSMEPTASDRLYCYRLVQVYDSSGTCQGFNVANARLVFAVSTKEEATYEYIMRLKRSYELQQGRDED